MKLLLSFSLAGLFSASCVLGQGGISEPECRKWTQTQVYDQNPDLKPAEDAYIQNVAAVIEANCMMDGDNKKDLQNCDIGLGESTLGTIFLQECTKTGGVVWQYDYSPMCDTTVSQLVKPVMACASSQCTGIGVINLIPAPGLLDPLTGAGYTCGTGTRLLKKVPTTSGSDGRATVLSQAIKALVGL